MKVSQKINVTFSGVKISILFLKHYEGHINIFAFSCIKLSLFFNNIVLGVIKAVFANINTEMPLANQIALFYKHMLLIGSVNYIVYLR